MRTHEERRSAEMKCSARVRVTRLAARTSLLAIALALLGHARAAPAELRVLRNGAKVVLSEERGRALVGLALFVDVEEGKGPLEARQVWASAFGTAVEGQGAVQEAIAAGGRLEVDAGWRQITVSQAVPKELAWPCLRTWGECLAQPPFSDQVIAEAKKRASAALQSRENDPYWLGQQCLQATYSSGRGLAGLKERERAIEAMDADVLGAFQRQYVAPSRLVLGVVGDFDTPEALAVVEQAFGSLEGESPGQLDATQAPPFPWGMGPVVTTEGRQGGLAYLAVAFSLEGASEEERVALELLALLMRNEIGDWAALPQQRGAGGVARGLLGVGVTPEGKEGTLVLYAVSHPLQIQQAVEAAEQWAAEWASKDIAETSLNRAKDESLYVTAMRWQSVRMEAAYWAAWAMTGETPEQGLSDGIRERRALIEKTAPESVRAVAGKFLRARHLAILMPTADRG